MKRRLAIATATAALPLAASAIRGASDNGNSIAAKRNNYSAKKQHRLTRNSSRPPVQDANQVDKIRSWHERQLEELCGEGGCWHDHPPNNDELHHQQQFEQQQQHGHRQLYSSGAHHKKKNYGHAHAEKAPDLGFQHKASSSSSSSNPPPNSPPAASPGKKCHANEFCSRFLLLLLTSKH